MAFGVTGAEPQRLLCRSISGRAHLLDGPPRPQVGAFNSSSSVRFKRRLGADLFQGQDRGEVIRMFRQGAFGITCREHL
jgi:hypothetical protein